MPPKMAGRRRRKRATANWSRSFVTSSNLAEDTYRRGQARSPQNDGSSQDAGVAPKLLFLVLARWTRRPACGSYELVPHMRTDVRRGLSGPISHERSHFP
ncbi:hypothetical protein D6D01_03001 [Aureobasidium pullulans]|uniref:Uncharacterized protein n=1 Tax=Aureobasidium pullulans TaxID=5580 RepID=A0A4S9LPL6_AURPU|nr:hypothetical protein D6D01_03001 [Aureobasidium pullulans]